MVAVLLALAAAASFSGSDFAAGLASRKASVLTVTVLSEGVNAAFIVPVVLLVSSRPPSASTLTWGAAAGVSGVAGIMALDMGFRYTAFSVASPVSAVTAAALPVLAGLASGERPGALALAGMALTGPAIVAVSAGAAHPDTGPPHTGPPHTGPPHTGPPDAGSSAGAAGTADGPPGADPGASTRTARGNLAGVAWSLAAGAGFALFLIGLNRAGSGTDLWPVAAAQLAGFATVGIAALVVRQLAAPHPATRFPAGTRRLALLSGLVAAVGTLSLFLATHHGLLAVTAVISSLYPAGTIVLARVVSGERLTRTGICGLVLAAASVSLIAAGTAG